MLCKQVLTALTVGFLASSVLAQNQDFRGGRPGFGQGQGQGFGQGQAGGKKGANGAAGATSATAVAATSVAATAANPTASAGKASGNAGDLELNPANVQTGSQSDGQAASGAASGQAPSATDDANFINFCQGKTLTNGLQVQAGSCNGIVMGDIPAKANMVSTAITFPQSGQDLQAEQTFTLKANVANLAAGSFTNPDVTYYAAPQQLNGGKVVGHIHFTVQDMGSSLNPTTALDPTVFSFFKGVNDDGDGQGNLAAVVTGGLKAGNYRVCTMSSASNHQPVLMPVAQRGAQDDCTKFTVGGGSGAGNSTATGGAAASGTATAASIATSAAAGNANAGTGAQGQQGQGRQGGRNGNGAKKGNNGAGNNAGKRSHFGNF